MKKADIVMMVHEKIGGTKVQAEEVVNGIFDAIAGSLAREEDVDVSGFGKFSVSHRKARTARNPRTGEPVQVPATKAPKFKAAKALKDTVKGA